MRRILFVISFLVGCFVCMEAAGKDKKYVNIVFVGNSITFGAGLQNPAHDAPPARAALYLSKQPQIASVKYSNQGVSGATTVDFLPETGTLFPQVTAAADQFKDETWATLLFSVMLGTNDSAMTGTNGAPVSGEQYRTNMRVIIDRLLSLYPDCRIVVQRPLWYSPNTYNGAKYLQEGLDRLQSYYPELKVLVGEYAKRFPGQVFLGDTKGFDYFSRYYQTDFQAEEGNAGVFYLHPNAKGARYLGELWGKALYPVIMKK